MKLTARYKIYSKTKRISSYFPLKILKFRRTKWFKLKKSYKKTLKRRKIADFRKTWVRFKIYKKIKSYYRRRLKTKQLIYQVYRNSFNFKFFRNYIKSKKTSFMSRVKSMSILLMKIEYRIDILLWRLNFFSNTVEARSAILSGDVLINNRKTSHIHFLKEGDTVRILSFIHLKEIAKLQKKTKFFYSFIEIDYYTKTLVILRGVDTLNYQDFSPFLNHPFNTLELYRIIMKK